MAAQRNHPGARRGRDWRFSRLNRTYSGRIIPNVAVQGTQLDRLYPGEARAVLRRRYTAFLATPVTFQFEGRTWQPTFEQLGVSVELDETVDRAYAVGRGLDVFSSASEVVAVWQDGIDLPIRISVDRHQLQSYLLEVAREVEQEPENAHLSVLNGQVMSTSARIGRQVMLDETAQHVLAGLPALVPQTVMMRTRELRPLIEDCGGMDVRVGRIVKQDGQVLYEDIFFSRFEPWPNIFVRGTGR